LADQVKKIKSERNRGCTHSPVTSHYDLEGEERHKIDWRKILKKNAEDTY
jgi:hypothetical protein